MKVAVNAELGFFKIFEPSSSLLIPRKKDPPLSTSSNRLAFGGAILLLL